MLCRRIISTLFPYTTLFRSKFLIVGNIQWLASGIGYFFRNQCGILVPIQQRYMVWLFSKSTPERVGNRRFTGDRKSTRLNSSHVAISYAVFCLKKKKRNTQ